MDKTFDAAEAEARIYAAWEEAGAFKAGRQRQTRDETFCIMIPPPNVTGSCIWAMPSTTRCRTS
jgi:valyl-tRNA synthetase